MCERDQWKAEWLAQTFPGVKAVFSDMKDLCKKEAHDFISGKKVQVPSVSSLQGLRAMTLKLKVFS